MSFDLQQLIRNNIRELEPYSSARDEFKGTARIYLDANENSIGSPLPEAYNRYPDPLQWQLKEKLGAVKGVPAENIFIGNGSDECIDILLRAVCEPGLDNIIICPPTYGMYQVCASINNVAVKKVSLTPDFQLDLPALEQAIDDRTKLIFICSPNNPTGNTIRREDIEVLLNNYFGLVVLDEAYINFSRFRSFTSDLPDYPQLVILQTMSKAWGLAGLRVGMAFAGKEIISVMNKIKPPYNISSITQQLATQALGQVDKVNQMIREIVVQREELEKALVVLPGVIKVYPSDANFLLVKVEEPRKIYQAMLDKGIVLRDRSNVRLCEGALRITVGTAEENKELLTVWQAL